MKMLGKLVLAGDYVYTMPMTAAHAVRDEVVNNAAVVLPPDMPYQPLAWAAITMFVDPQTHTTGTLYGNEVAMQDRRGAGSYSLGAVLALVTWAQREDPHWFGARIPDRPLAVEFVEPGAAQPGYRRFSRNGLAVVPSNSLGAQRTKFVLGLAPASLP